MKIQLLDRLRLLVETLGAQSVSIGTGPEHMALTCLPNRMEAFLDVPALAERILGSDILGANACESLQILWAGPHGMGRTSLSPSSLDWSLVETIPGAYNPVFSLIITGEGLEAGARIYAFNVETVHLNCSRVGGGLPFSMGDIRGQVIHDESFESLALANAGQVTPFRQACHLVIWVRDRQTIPDPLALLQEMARVFREKFLKASENFPADQIRTAVDLESLKTIARHPQDLAALLGLGLRLKPNLERQEIEWEVDRYLFNPVVLEGFDATACIEASLPIATAEFTPDWAPSFIPSIPEMLPKNLLKESNQPGVYLVENILAGELPLPYLLVQPSRKILAGGVRQSPERPLLLLARNGRKASEIAGGLAGRPLFLGAMLRLLGELGTLKRHRIVLDRYPFRFDPLLAALWLVGNAINLTRGEASSLGRLKKSALSVSLAMAADIEAVRKKKPDPAADQALAQALVALRAKREKLLGRLSKRAKVKDVP